MFILINRHNGREIVITKLSKTYPVGGELRSMIEGYIDGSVTIPDFFIDSSTQKVPLKEDLMILDTEKTLNEHLTAISIESPIIVDPAKPEDPGMTLDITSELANIKDRFVSGVRDLADKIRRNVEDEWTELSGAIKSLLDDAYEDDPNEGAAGDDEVVYPLIKSQKHYDHGDLSWCILELCNGTTVEHVGNGRSAAYEGALEKAIRLEEYLVQERLFQQGK
jgi:hypothetical protein